MRLASSRVSNEEIWRLQAWHQSDQFGQVEAKAKDEERRANLFADGIPGTKICFKRDGTGIFKGMFNIGTTGIIVCRVSSDEVQVKVDDSDAQPVLKGNSWFDVVD